MTDVIILIHTVKNRIVMIPQNVLWGRINNFYKRIGKFEL